MVRRKKTEEMAVAAAPRTAYAKKDEDQVHVAYQVVGDGPVDILVAPGFISHLDLNMTMPAYAAFVDHLARFARVILFDKRGTGLSDVSPDAAQFEARMADIELVLDAAGSKEAVLFGMSEGGPLTSLFAATHADRVRSLVLYGTFPCGSVIDQATLERFDDAVDNWGDGRTAGIFLQGSDGPVVRRFTGMFERTAASPGMARALLRSIHQCDVRGVLPNLAVPTLVLNRRDDPFASRAWSEEIAATVPDARHVEVEGDDHMPWMGDAAPLIQALEEFVTGETAARPSRTTMATVLFTDIVDSTHQLALVGDRDWASMIQQHNDLSREIIDRHGGWGVKSTGDGFLACFDTPARGARCALELRLRLSDLGIGIRSGLHCGEIERVDVVDVTGIAVNLAARVGAEAGGGEILATRVLADQLVGAPCAASDRGPHDLKGIPGPVELVALDEVDRQVIDLTLPRQTTVIDQLTAGMARRAPRLVRGIAQLTGARG